MARTKKFIEPINADFEELAIAVVSPWHKKEEKDEKEKDKTVRAYKPKKTISKCTSSSKRSASTHSSNKKFVKS